jgi:3-dehydroquinate dehydratase-2
MIKLDIINGPNINLLGIREKKIYGSVMYDEFVNVMEDYCARNNVKVRMLQSNSEGELINFIHSSYKRSVDGIIINPGAFTHYSYAIRDALLAIAVDVSTIEVHMSNIYSREKFRSRSVITSVCIGQISGFGIASYKLAVDFFCTSKIST